MLKRFLMPVSLAAVGHGLVERLKVFERGLVTFVRGLAEVFVEPPVCGSPGFARRAAFRRLLDAQHLMKIEIYIGHFHF